MAGSIVMQTPVAPCLIQMSALTLSPLSHSRSTSTPLPPNLPSPNIPPLHYTPSQPRLHCRLFSGRPFAFSSPSKSLVCQERTGKKKKKTKKKREMKDPRSPTRAPFPGGCPVSQRMGLFPGPAGDPFHIQMIQSGPPTHRGALYGHRPQVVGSRW